MRSLEGIYEETRRRLAGLVRGSAEAQLAAPVPVPACPGWSVHDVLAHLAGVCADILAGNVAGAATDAWTAAQIETRRGWTTAEVLAQWDDLAPKVAAMLDDFPGRYGQQVVSDVASHAHDVRGARGLPGARDSEAVSVGLDFFTSVIAHPKLVALGRGPLEIRAGDQTWQVGRAGPPSEVDADWRRAVRNPHPLPTPTTAPAETLAVDPFELLRALTGRRSAAQIRRFGWSGDPEPYLPMFGAGPFTIRETDLVE